MVRDDDRNQNVCVSIPQAAKVLKVTTKTVRNYIDRGYLPAEKWNGAWRIEEGKLLEVYWKKYGNQVESPSASLETEFVQIPLEEYDQLQRLSGRLQATESITEGLSEDLRMARSKVIEMEASSASGWTEARTYREEKEILEKALRTVQRRERQASMKLLVSSEKLEDVVEIKRECLTERRRLRRENKELRSRLETQAAELKRCEKRLKAQKNRARRTSSS